jgi:hypothetical protein
MKTLTKKQKFIQAVEKLANTGLVSVLKKGEHGTYLLGNSCIGSTYSQNEKIWKKYQTLSNIVIFKTANEVNDILSSKGIKEFKATPTKSKTMCRLTFKN